MTYAIEKGVPIPMQQGSRNGVLPYPFADMQLGDSFVVPVPRDTPAKNIQGIVGNHARKYRENYRADFAVTTRVIDSGNAVRVWCVAYVEPAKRTSAKPPAPIANLEAPRLVKGAVSR